MRSRITVATTIFIFLSVSTIGTASAQATCDSFATQTAAQLMFDITQSDELDPDGDGIACEELEGDAAPRSGEQDVIASGDGPDEPTDQEEEYLNNLDDDMNTVIDVSGELADLFSEAGNDVMLFLDQEWVIDVAAQFVELQQVGIDAASLDPSARQQGIHDVWLEINRLMTLAVDDYIFGIDNLDPASIEQGTARFLWAATLTEDLNGAISAFEDDPNTMFEPAYPLYPLETCDPFQDYETAQLYYGANPEEQPTLDPDFDGLACEVFFEME